MKNQQDLKIISISNKARRRIMLSTVVFFYYLRLMPQPVALVTAKVISSPAAKLLMAFFK